MLYNSIEEELWRIYTFYTLHADSSQPEVLRPAVFLRFSKDCQIISKRLPSTAVDLEVTRVVRSKYSDNSEFNPTITITFADFLDLIEVLAQKVYPKDTTESAVQRLLLENILLLANRRIPQSDIYDLSHPDANRVVRELFGRSLLKIFEHYLDKADKRRNQAITAEKMKNKDLRALTDKDVTALAAIRQHTLQHLKEMVKSQKDLISYKEYVQFCYDFNLKSTSLLTAVQVGEIYLNVVPLHSEYKSESGMNYDSFCKCIIFMAFVGYRDIDPSVTVESKMKALLCYMWKAVNDSEKTLRLMSNNRSNTMSAFAGSLNIFGSGGFSDQFLDMWMRDNFVDYSLPREDGPGMSGSAMLRTVVGEGMASSAGGGVHATITSPSHHINLPAPAPSLASPTGKQIATAKVKNNSSTNVNANRNNKPNEYESAASVLQNLQKTLSTSSTTTVKKGRRRSSAGSIVARRTNSIYIKAFNDTAQTKGLTHDHLQFTARDGNKHYGNAGGLVAMAPQTAGIVVPEEQEDEVLYVEGVALAELFRRRPEISEFVFMEIQNLKLDLADKPNIASTTKKGNSPSKLFSF